MPGGLAISFIMKTYQIGNNRVVEVVNDGADYNIIIKDTNSSAEAVFNRARWTFLLGCVTDIQGAVEKLIEGKDTELQFRQHYGGGWYVSVTAGIRCVDLRRFFLNDSYQVKPTRHGIGLRLPEWETLKNVFDKIRVDFPDLNNTLGCFHADLGDWVNCQECMPFFRNTSSSSSTRT